jgi:hypothetical protein
MSLNTRAENKNKHPGVVDLSPQRRTHAQKRADDKKSEEEKQAREAVRQAGIQHLAKVEEQTAQKMKMLMGPGPKPHP